MVRVFFFKKHTDTERVKDTINLVQNNKKKSFQEEKNIKFWFLSVCSLKSRCLYYSLLLNLKPTCFKRQQQKAM